MSIERKRRALKVKESFKREAKCGTFKVPFCHISVIRQYFYVEFDLNIERDEKNGSR